MRPLTRWSAHIRHRPHTRDCLRMAHSLTALSEVIDERDDRKLNSAHFRTHRGTITIVIARRNP